MNEELARGLGRAQELIGLRRDAQALEVLANLLAEHPDGAGDIHVLMAAAHAAAGRRAEAIASARLAVAAEPQDALTHFSLGARLREAGRRREAIRSLEKTIELEPDWAEPHQQRAMVLSDLRRGREAVEAAQLGLELSNGEADAHFAFGYVLHESNPEAARQAYEAALAAEPQHTAALHNLASLRLTRGDLAGGTRGMADVLARSPQAQMPLTVLDLNLGIMLQRLHWLTFGSLWALGIVSNALTSDSVPRVAALVLLVVVFAGLTTWGWSIVRKRLRPIRASLPHGGERYLRQFARRDPLGAAWAGLLALVWLALTLGVLGSVIGLADRGVAPLLGAVGAGFILLIAGVIVSWLRVPALKRRAARHQFLDD
ncbi:MAG: hypothetical protein L0G22_04285 [Propionibacteriaceae bacterium]|nr:hypothetical protein [Propionibacteriaceae bacterium]